MKKEGIAHLEVSVPLLIRCLEWAREEAKTDVQVHEFVERMIASSKGKTLDSSLFPKFIKEDAPTNNMGDGKIADPQNKPVGKPNRKQKYLSRLKSKICPS